MIRPERMERISIVGPKTRLATVIDILHKHAVMHIVDHRRDELDTGAPLEGSSALSEQLIRARSLLHSLGASIEQDEPSPKSEGDITAQLAIISDQVTALDFERKKANERITLLNHSKPTPTHERDLQALHATLEANDAARERARESHSPFLLAAEHFLAVEARKAQTPIRFAATKNAFMISGWAPVKETPALSAALERATDGEIYIEHIPGTDGAPIKLDNNQLVSPYELLLRMYTIPKYHELDPSFFIFLSFPLFFGFILGDIGYGLVLLIGALIVRTTRRKNKPIVAVTHIVIASAIATIIFGAIYGEFFGASDLGFVKLPYLIHRAHDIMTLLIVAIGVGVVHISIALITGFIEEARHHGGWKAFCAKASWLILLIGAGLIGAAKVFDTQTTLIGGLLMGLAVILIIIGEGARGLVELPGIFSNIASYARLMAVGVASAGLAIVVNELAGGLFASGNVISIIIGVIVLIVGHIINITLGILGSFIHGLRLNYVEFFGKFYEGGGKAYRPFGSEESK